MARLVRWGNRAAPGDPPAPTHLSGYRGDALVCPSLSSFVLECMLRRKRRVSILGAQPMSFLSLTGGFATSYPSPGKRENHAHCFGRSLFFVGDSASGIGIGTSSTNSPGLNNAVRPANKLVNINSGTAGLVNEISGLILPTTEINSGMRRGPR